MHESPQFTKLKSEGKISTNPLKESFRNRANFKMVLLALFGATMGQGVIWYTGQFYAQSFLENACKLDFNESRYILIIAIALATPFFIVFGSWSDRVGRKWIMMAGMFLGIISYRPIYQYFLDNSDYTKSAALASAAPVVKHELVKDSKDSLTTVTIAKTFANGASYNEVTTTKKFEDHSKAPEVTTIQQDKKLAKNTFWIFVGLVFYQILLVTMVYGPIAAFLVELFPTKIRYTSMSLPYHIGNGVFGGLVPFIATLITSFPGSTPLSGLWYPIGIAALCLIIGTFYLSNKIDQNVAD